MKATESAPGPAPSPAPNHARNLLSLDEALARLVRGARAHTISATETLSTFEALGRVLAVDVRSALDVPPADNTSMDGYAVRAADVGKAGVLLPVSQRIPAGAVGQPLQAGTAARIFTGAQVPPGADSVVMQEQCEAVASASGVSGVSGASGAAGATSKGATRSTAAHVADAGLGHVRINAVPATGQWVRRRGEDVQHGAVVLARGTRLTPQALGLAASVGAGQLQVLRRPRVAVFSTGDELIMPGEPLKPGAIYNSNRFTLRGLLQAAGCEVTDLGIVPDKLEATRAALRQAARHNDLIVTSGGVSVGEEDHLRPAVMAEGRIENWQIAMKPGKPLAFGSVRRGEGAGAPVGEALFVGLPGNPVSSFVTFLLAVSTVLRTLQGMDPSLPQALPLQAGFDWLKPDKRREFLRVRLGAEGRLELFPNQSSGVLTSAVWGDGLVDVPAAQAFRAGAVVQYVPLSELIGR